MISMRRTIYRRIAVIVVASVVCASALFTALLYREIVNQVHDDVDSRSLLIAKTLDQIDANQAQQAQAQAGGNRDVLPTLTRLSATSATYRITLIAADGTPLFDSQATVATMENHANRPEFIAARATGAGQATRFSATVGTETYYSAKLLSNGNVLRVAQTTRTIYGVWLRQLPWVGGVIIVVLLASLAVSRRLTRSLVRPIAAGAGSAKGEAIVYEELAPYLAQREAADKIRRQFSANVSHELKTPLTSIVGRAELLENGLVKPADVAGFGASIRTEGQRLLELIEDVMRISQLDEDSSLRMQTFQMSGVIAEVFESLADKARRAQVRLINGDDELEVTTDRNMMFELLYNLVDNAIKYNRTDGTGTVTVRTEQNMTEAGLTSPVIEVIDTGIGIPEEDQQRVFERFYRVDRSRSKETGGTGLGLSIVKHLAGQIGAEVELQSTLGQGATFRLRLT
ncbi:MAG: ATP-binding protein [Coriobacteriia bacterium]|nr:ATP-binding protein [Coriobacteriia bacterium]